MKKIILIASIWLLIFSAPANCREKIPIVPRLLTTEEVIINSPAEKVWSIIKDFGDLSWHPGVKAVKNPNGNKENAERLVTLNNDGAIGETLIKYKASLMTITYKAHFIGSAKTITHAGTKEYVPVIPVHKYTALIKVESLAEKSKVSWKAGYWPAHFWDKNPPPEMNSDAAKAAVSTFIKQGLANLKALAEK